jgi:amino acid adenylation domain-containing protein
MSQLAARLQGLSPQKRELLLRQLRQRAAGTPPPRPEIQPLPRDGRGFPLSYAQQRLWFLDQLEPGSAAYNMPAAVRLSGRLDEAALARAVAEVARRHEALRTTFASQDGRPVQRIAPPPALPLPVVDLSALGGARAPEAAREAAARALAGAEIRRPFDLAAGPPMRALLLRLSPVERVLVLTVHHIVCDAWSMRILVRETAAIYAALAAPAAPAAPAAGSPAPAAGLPALPVQYADYAAAERQWLDDAMLAPQLDHWRQRLAGLGPPLELPADRARPPAQSFRGAHRPVALPAPVAAALRALAQREGATLFTVLLAALLMLLRRYTGRDDLTVGTPIANRDRPEIEPLVGLFVNTLVLRGDLAGDPPFRQLLAGLREQVLEDFAHRDLPFERLVEELQPERDLAHSPLFQVLFAFQSMPFEAPAAGGLVVRPLALESGRSLFDLTLTLEETPASLGGALEYNSDLFDAARIQRLAGHWAALLAAIAEAPARRLSELALLTAAERHQLLAEGGESAAAAATAAPGWPGRVDQRFERLAALHPARLAVTARGGRRTYGEVAAGAAALAARLLALGLGRGEVVAVAMGRSALLPEALLGVWRAGGAYLPLDPGYPEERLLYMLADAGCRLLLADETTPPALLAGAAEVLWMTAADPGTPARRLDPGPGGVAPSELAYVLYTSGSTGRPKGVEVSHGALANLLQAMTRRINLGEADVLLAVSSLSFDIAATELYLPLLAGARIELVEREAAADGAQLAERLGGSGATVLQGTPSTWRLLLESGWAGSPRLVALTAGEALSERLAAELLARTRELWNLYGPTETAIYSAGGRVEPGEPVRLGGPIDGTTLVVMGVDMEPAPMGVAGELWIGGAGLARGYRGRPELTAERFVPDPCGGGGEPGARMYRTGDLTRRDGRGRLEFLGRIDQQVKVRGFRIEPGEVESALESHPAVGRAAVAADGAGGGRLIAYLAPRRAQGGGEAAALAEAPVRSLEIPALRAHLAQSLPGYMIPTAWVELPGGLPLTPGGKVDRRRLAEHGVPAAARAARPPRRPAASPDEELLAAIWEEVLGVPDVGPEDSFFDLGGHSLLATRVVARVRRAWAVELPLRALFELPTVARLAAHLAALKAGGQAAAVPPITALLRDPRPRHAGDQARAAARLPLSFGQQRLWFLDRLEPGGAAYNMPAAVRLRGELDAAAMAAGLSEVVRRHEVLRTVFALDGGEPVQVPLAAAAVALPRVDLTGLPAGRREAAAGRLLAAAAGRPFDLAAGPLLRPLLVRLDAREHLLLVVVHHIASDAWSMGLLVRELSLLYAAAARRAPSPLGELPLQYADYAAWQRGWLRGEALAAQLAWWRQALAGAPPLLDLPADRPRPARQSFRGGRVAHRLAGLPGRPLGEAVRALGRTQGATAFMIHLAAFQALLGRLAGQRLVVVGTPIANRRHAELEGLIGFFVNTLALAADLGGEPSFAGHLARVRETALGAYAHQDLPFEKLVEDLDPRRSLAHAPLFQVLLSARDLPPAPAAGLPGLEVAPAGTRLGAAKFDLTLEIDAGGASAAAAGIDAELEYSADLFDRATATRLLLAFETLLAAAVAGPAVPLGDLPLLAPAERAQLLVAWNDTGPPAAAACMHELLAAQADRAPAERALAWRGQELTRGELEVRANRLAHRLRGLGVGPEVRVGICMERSPAMVAAMLAVWKAGGAYLPLDPAYPRQRLELMVEDSGALVVLSEERPAGRLGPRVPVLCLDREAAALERLPAGRPEPAAVPGNLAYLIYTSGSTGRPKGVAIEHRSAAALVEWARDAFDPGELAAVLASTSICFDLSVFELFVPLACGGSVVLADNVLELPALAAAGVSLVNTVPSAAAELVRAAGLPASVRAVCLAGEPLPRALVDALHAAAAATPGSRLARVLNLYGPSEDTTYSTWAVAPSGSALAPTIGRPVAGTRGYVVDARLQPLPLGVPGELCLGGQGLARGYLGRPELTAERFVPDPFAGAPGGRLYRTGDLVRHRPDGELLFLGRLDHQVKLRGFRIELGEIEAALLAHPGIAEAAVVSTKSGDGALDQRGRGDGSSAAAAGTVAAAPAAAMAAPGRLVAYVVAKALSVEELRGFLAARLPSFMVPWAFVQLAALPRNANGKLDRGALPDPERQAWGATAAVEEPRSEAERQVAAVWQEVLGLDRVSVHDNFFDSGGHSLLAVRAHHRLRAAFGRDFPLVALFEHPTIEALARYLGGGGGAQGRESAAAAALEAAAAAGLERAAGGAGAAAGAEAAAAAGTASAARRRGQERGARRRAAAAGRRAAGPGDHDTP